MYKCSFVSLDKLVETDSVSQLQCRQCITQDCKTTPITTIRVMRCGEAEVCNMGLSHKAKTLKELRVCFDLDQSFSKSWSWIFQQDLILLLIPIHIIMLYRPEEFLNRSSGGDSSSVDFKSLKELSFKCVNVTGETIEFFCVQLSIAWSITRMRY